MVARLNLSGDADRLERLREPSHGTLLTADRITSLLTSAGAAPERAGVFGLERPLRPWLAQALPADDPARAIGRETAELDGGPATGLRPPLRHGELWFPRPGPTSPWPSPPEAPAHLPPRLSSRGHEGIACVP
ncbi:hypothetical protein [Streptomyces sp. NPDC046805]|uniref:hypothetical protein n=1 Tax=Streptomyces sp. NPDC046805 TaxID=3155134 RepID=UPI0033E357B8